MTVAVVPEFDWQGAAGGEADLLGLLHFGMPAAPPTAAPQLRVAAPMLAPALAWQAGWRLDGEPSAGHAGRVHYRCADGLLFGVLTVAEADFAAADPATALQRATTHAYTEVFACADALAHPRLLRVWNYLPRINQVEFGLERYRAFNAGRQLAFSASGRTLTGEVPAACALGSADGELAIAFIATTGRPRAVENPRQLSAYHYPAEYGPRSPTFSRAALLQHGGGTLLFVSGTASIVGHRSVHLGDARAQTVETLANIEAVLTEAGRVGGERFAADSLAYIAYVRHAADYPAVRAEVEARLGPRAAVAYVQADVCRAELLVEIEASGGHPIRGWNP
ncbi:hypothetical protein [Azoarcus olearius]|uniref:Chorismatase FkbO/Hyg5-like N-terminal domain-containing protein n=1 Tax=Azoarcus sp. (strain BH72) TaxID=418699 RepID=A1KCI0_AZOSB|nr:hypothetical protein [Azoarcus olearius]CAL96536.1 Conserved Hypothetical protein [Azoarcus olearius]